MITLTFADSLVNNRFAHSYQNQYNYNDAIERLPMYFIKKDEEYPYILNSGKHGDKSRIIYSNTYQFSGRNITVKKFKEVFDSSRILLKVVVGNNYLVGKGFIIALDENDKMEILFAACVPYGKAITDMIQVKYYISRKIYSAANKKIVTAVTDFMKLHKGEMVITNDVEKYIGHNIKYPALKSLSEKKKYGDMVISRCIAAERKELNLVVA